MREGYLAILLTVLIGSTAAVFGQGQATTSQATQAVTSKKAVQEAQQRLKALGYQPGAADGVMGAKVIAALKKFQTDHGLSATGALDQKTTDALNTGDARTTKPKADVVDVSASASPRVEPTSLTIEGKIFVNSRGDQIAFAKDGRAVEVNAWHDGELSAYAGQTISFGQDGNTPHTECTYSQDGAKITVLCEPGTNAVFTVNKDGTLSGPPEGIWGETAFTKLVLTK